MSQRLPLFQLLSISLLVLALGLRLGGMTSPPTDFHHVAQSKSVSIAMNMAASGFEITAPRVDWHGAHPGLATSGIPLYELAVGAGWAGVEQLGSSDYLWARSVSLMGWILGGLALLVWVRRRLRGPPVLYLLLYLFAPLGVVMSRNIQPDSLALGIFLASLLLLDLRRDAHSRGRAIGLLLLGGLGLGLSLGMDATLVGGLAAPLWLACLGPRFRDATSGGRTARGVLGLVVLLLLAFLPLGLWVTHLQDQGRPEVLSSLVGWTVGVGGLWQMMLEPSSWRPMGGTGLVALVTPVGAVAMVSIFGRRDALGELMPFVLGLFGLVLWFLPWGLLFGSRTFELYPILPFASVAAGSGLVAMWERLPELSRRGRTVGLGCVLSLLGLSIILGSNFSSKAHERDRRMELWGSLLPTLVGEDRPVVVSDIAPETILVASGRRGWASGRLSMSAISRFEQAGARYLLLTSDSPMWMNRGFRMQIAETRPEVARAERFVVYALRGQSTMRPGVSGVPMP